jgi:hypothetical protein
VKLFQFYDQNGLQPKKGQRNSAYNGGRNFKIIQHCFFVHFKKCLQKYIKMCRIRFRELVIIRLNDGELFDLGETTFLSLIGSG